MSTETETVRESNARWAMSLTDRQLGLIVINKGSYTRSQVCAARNEIDERCNADKGIF